MQSKYERLLILASFAAIYFIWGSTYLANWYAIQDVPPFIMGGSRFFTAGLVFYLISLLFKNKGVPSIQHWKNSFYVGSLFLALGTGGILWAEQYIDSNFAALLVGFEPMVIVLLMWRFRSKKPGWSSVVGVLIGGIGVYLLVGQPTITNDWNMVFGIIAISISMLAWGVASVFMDQFALPAFRMRSIAMQMIGGGISLFIMAILIGEFQHFAFANITLRALYAWLYLIVFGSFIGFSAFNYLLAKVSPDKVATAGYVNPIVALFLGWGLNNEAVSIQSIVAALILLVSVFLINSGKRRIGMVGRWRRMKNKPKAS